MDATSRDRFLSAGGCCMNMCGLGLLQPLLHAEVSHSGHKAKTRRRAKTQSYIPCTSINSRSNSSWSQNFELFKINEPLDISIFLKLSWVESSVVCNLKFLVDTLSVICHRSFTIVCEVSTYFTVEVVSSQKENSSDCIAGKGT